MVIWEIFGISVSSGQIKTHSFRLLQWVAQYQDLPSLKRYENLGFGAIWVRVGIRRNRRRNAHRTRAFVQCAEMQMSSLQHGEGCDCAAVKSCPGCQSWIIPRKGKASISRRGGGGGDFIMARHADLARSSTHQGNRGRHPASQMNGFMLVF